MGKGSITIWWHLASSLSLFFSSWARLKTFRPCVRLFNGVFSSSSLLILSALTGWRAFLTFLCLTLASFCKPDTLTAAVTHKQTTLPSSHGSLQLGLTLEIRAYFFIHSKCQLARLSLHISTHLESDRLLFVPCRHLLILYPRPPLVLLLLALPRQPISQLKPCLSLKSSMMTTTSSWRPALETCTVAALQQH